MKKRVLVIGASGFIGTSLFKWFSENAAYELIGTSRPDEKLISSNRCLLDLEQPSMIERVLSDVKPAVILNAAGGLPGVGQVTESNMIRANFQTAVNLMEVACNVAPEARVVLLGSAAEYGIQQTKTPLDEEALCRPGGAYGFAKSLATSAAGYFRRRHKLDVVVARIFNVLGPGISTENFAGALIEKLFQAKGKNRPIEVGAMSAFRDFVDIEDLAQGLFLIANAKQTEPIYNICSGKPSSIRELAHELCLQAGLSVSCLVESGPSRSENPSYSVGSNAKIAALGFTVALSLKDSARRMWAHRVGPSSSK